MGQGTEGRCGRQPMHAEVGLLVHAPYTSKVGAEGLQLVPHQLPAMQHLAAGRCGGWLKGLLSCMPF